ncbi:YdcF family protein [Azoarcus sp. KH32C]|uniref:YdcF family protein n=1 Tax=Azoarcus sp. KH32C TaxID=748247 RepID=UPI00155ACBD5|nr:ElyC/SanA/YdcF family protein [Azoarcus sp. KH32C]
MEGEDGLDELAPLIVVLGGGVAGERLNIACDLFHMGHGREGVVLTGGNQERFVPDRVEVMRQCGVPDLLLKQWPSTANSFEEMQAVERELAGDSRCIAIVVSDALHMPRLRYLRNRLGLAGSVYLRQSRLIHRFDLDYVFRVVMFWFREPLAYIYYRMRY